MNSEQSGDVSRYCYDQCYMAHALLRFEARFAPVYGHHDRDGQAKSVQNSSFTDSLRAADEHQSYNDYGYRGGMVPAEPFADQRHGLDGGECGGKRE